MPHNSAQWITHVVEGGWATDYGKTLYASPQNGELRIPWLKTCENIKFYSDGSFGPYPGTRLMYDTPLLGPQADSGLSETTKIHALYDYVRMGSSTTGTRKRLAMVGTWLYNIDGDPPYIIGEVTGNAYSVPHMTTFNDLLIVTSGQTPKSWDQTTFQSLAGTPPSFHFSTHHAGRHWAAGATANPSRLYYSAVGNPEDWVGAGSGSIDIDPGDGDAIVGILSHKKELWVFKGPHQLSIHRITGTSPSDFARTTFIKGVSAAGHSSIFPVGDDFGFWSPRGSCHSLAATDTYGDYQKSYINYPILSWCRNANNVDSGIYSTAWQTITNEAQGVSYTVLNNHQLDNTSERRLKLLAFDWNFRTPENPYPRIIPLTFGYISSVGLTSSVFNDTQLVPTFGTWHGLIHQELDTAVNIPYFRHERDSSTVNTIKFNIETPALTYGPSYQTKSISAVGIDLIDNTGIYKHVYGSVNLSVGGRNSPSQTVSLGNKGFIGLDSFTLDQDQLGDLGDIGNFTESVTGESPSFTYSLSNTSTLIAETAQNARIKHFGVLLNPSSSSLENF